MRRQSALLGATLACCALIDGCATQVDEAVLGEPSGSAAQGSGGSPAGSTSANPATGGSAGAGTTTAGGAAASGGGSGAQLAGAAGSSATAGGPGVGVGSGGAGGALGCTPGASLLGAPIYDAEALNAQGHDYVQTTASGFFVYYDEAHAGKVAPAATMPQLGVTSGNGGSLFRVTGSTLAADFWGAGAGLWVSPCIDVGAITGVKFWLKSDRPVRVAAMTPATTISTGGGTCAQNCKPNSITLPLPPKPAGETVSIAFEAFVGGSAPLDRSKFTGLELVVDAPGGAPWSFDLQLDELGLY